MTKKTVVGITFSSQIRPLFSIAFYSLKALLRNKATVFFGFAFPLFFISAFGLIGGGSPSVTLGIPLESQTGPIYENIRSIESVEIKSGTEDSLKNKLFQGQIAGVLVIKNNSPKIFVSQADPGSTSAVTSVVNGVVDKLNLELSGIKDPPIRLDTEEISGRSFDFIDFLAI